MKKALFNYAMFLCIVGLSVSCAHTGWDPSATETAKNQNINNKKVAETIAAFKNSDPQMKTFFKKAYGYAVFPTVGKGVMGIGERTGKAKYMNGKY